MSTIVCLKERNMLVLGTDSRFMDPTFTAVHSDATQKIFEVARGMFLATSGWGKTCRFQQQKARDLAARLGTSDIAVIAEALGRDSIPCLEELAAILATLKPCGAITAALNGEQPLHGTVLAGRGADGKLGYVCLTFWRRAGQIVCEPGSYFGASRRFCVTYGGQAGEAVQRLGRDRTIWTAPPVWVVKRFLSVLKESSPQIGGPDQIVQLDGDGAARWVSPPPEGQGDPAPLMTGTITALLQMISPTITGGEVNGAIFDILDEDEDAEFHAGLDDTYGAYLVGWWLSQGTAILKAIATGIYTQQGAALTAMGTGGVSTQNATHSAAIAPGSVSVDGDQVLAARGATVSDPSGGATVDSQARTAINTIIDRLQAHGLIS
jgi:hypothetical protein